MKRRTYLALLLTLMLSEGIAVFNAAIFSSDSAHADSFESSVGVAFTLNPTVTISITGGTGTTNDGLTIANLTPGDVKDSNIITVSATANTPLGYSLGSTVGSSTYNYTDLRISSSDETNVFSTLSSPADTIHDIGDSKWGYSYSTDSGSTWRSGDITTTSPGNYSGLPIYTSSSPIKLINSNTAGSSSIQFKIGAKASSTQIAGTYNNIINFIGTGKIVTTEYTINYNDPSGEAESMPTQQKGTESVGTGAVAISSTQPTRANYLFKGWCTSQVADDADCPANDTLIQPGGLLALNPGTSSATATVTKDLYAIWKDNSPAPSKIYIQDFTADMCSSQATGEDVTVYDKRDENDYTVSYIASSCWMTQNLRFQGTDLKVGESDVTSDITMTYGQLTSGNSYTEPRIATGSTTDYGTYYNYCAASAGEVCNDTTQQDATRSVCPAGWKLPTRAQLNALPRKESHFIASSGLAGYYDGGSLKDAGTSGVWWASAADSATRQYSLYYVSDYGIWGVSNILKYSGNSVRCVRAS